MKATYQVIIQNCEGENFGIDVEEIKFPSGEVAIHLEEGSLSACGGITRFMIITRGYEPDQLFKIALIKDALQGMVLIDQPLIMQNHWVLVLPYLPNARYDRRMVENDAHALKVYGQMLNSLGFNEVLSYDAHSYVAHSCIENFNHVPVWSFIRGLDKVHNISEEYTALVAPDAGSTKKVEKVADELGLPVVQMTKRRDPSTGQLSAPFVLHGLEHLKGGKLLIVDDICDGGYTFIQATQLLKVFDVEKVGLYVTHGIFSKGVDVLYDAGIDEIFTTDTLRLPEEFDSRVKGFQLIQM